MTWDASSNSSEATFYSHFTQFKQRVSDFKSCDKNNIIEMKIGLVKNNESFYQNSSNLS